MANSHSHIAFTVAANQVGAWMRSRALRVATGAKTTHSSLTVMHLR